MGQSHSHCISLRRPRADCYTILSYGKPGSSRGEIETAARLACMHDRISSGFADGYATLVGERGVRLSGGEKQRVSIARAFLKDSPVLVLDEATSALDTSTEREIQSALRSLMRGRSSLSVAHRLSVRLFLSTGDTFLIIFFFMKTIASADLCVLDISL